MADVNEMLGIKHEQSAKDKKSEERDAGIENVMKTLEDGIESGSPVKEKVIELTDADIEDITDTTEGAMAEVAAQNEAKIAEARKALEEIDVDVSNL